MRLFTISSLPLAGLFSSYLLLSGCAGSPSVTLPTTIPDGSNSYSYQSEFRRIDYTGQFKNSAPNGEGVMRAYDGEGQLTESCKGEFATSGNTVRGEGKLFRPDGTVAFNGQLTAYLDSPLACHIGPKGVYISAQGWTLASSSFSSISFRFGVEAKPGPCTISDPQGNSWTGNCSLPSQSKHAAIDSSKSTAQSPSYLLPELGYEHGYLRFTGGGVERFQMANGPGVMRFANGEQVEGNFDLGHLEDGLVKVTAPDGKVFQAIASNGNLGPRQLAPEQLARNGQACGFPGWRIVSGRCEQNTWSGDVDAYDATGMERISGPFKKGVPNGTINWSRLDSGLQVRGKMVTNNGGLSFTQGLVSVGGIQAYEGEMRGFAPNGNGICTVSGSPERCEFVQGERVDALYKTRLENDRLRGEIAANQQAQQLAQQQAAARQQAAAAAAAEDDSGDMFGKVMAIGIGAGAVSSVSGVSSTIRNQMITGMAADILTDGKAGGIANAQRNLGVQSSAGNPPALYTLSGASMGNNTTLKGSSAVAGTDASNATLQNIAGMGSTAGHAERSQKLDDIVAKVAADSGMKTLNATYQCAPGDPVQSVTVPYKTEACAAAKKNWFSVYACNDVEHMSAANQQCIQGCGNANCDEQ